MFIECGNMRNTTDARLLHDPNFRQTAAQALNDAMVTFLNG